MVIEKISYSGYYVGQIIDEFSPEFELEKQRTLGYNTSAEYGTLILGPNTNHLDAYYLSDLPMVVFDLHTDMYSTIKNNVMKRYMNILNSNWIFWRLKKGSEVHLVVPRFNYIPTDINIPADNKDNFHIYSVEEHSGEAIGLLYRGEKSKYKLDVLSIDYLESLREIKKQVSFDLDFMRTTDTGVGVGVDVEVANGLLETVINHEDVYDFWFDSPKLYDLEVQANDLRTFINTINSISPTKTEV